MSTEQTTPKPPTEAEHWKTLARKWADYCQQADAERDDWKRRARHNLAVVHELREQNAALLDRLTGKGDN